MLNRFRKLLKRSGALIGVLLVLICCALPASAALNADYLACVPFDYLGILEGEAYEQVSRYPYPGNGFGPSFSNDGFTSSFNGEGFVNDYENFLQLSSVLITDTGSLKSVYLLDYPGSDYGIEFYSSGFVIDQELLAGAADDPFEIHLGYGTGSYGGRYSVTFNAWSVSSSGNQYEMKSQTFTDSGFLSANVPVNFFQIVYGLIKGQFSYAPGNYVYITDLSIKFFLTDTVTHISVVCPTVKTLPTVSQWFYQYDTVKEIVYDAADPSGVSFVDWLTVAVGGFLDFQLWPGMSLDEIMWICLVTGVLFWFLKLTI